MDVIVVHNIEVLELKIGGEVKLAFALGKDRIELFMERVRELREKRELGLMIGKDGCSIFSDRKTLGKLILYALSLKNLDTHLEKKVYQTLFDKSVDCSINEEEKDKFVEKVLEGREAVAGVFLHRLGLSNNYDAKLEEKIRMELKMESLMNSLLEDCS